MNVVTILLHTASLFAKSSCATRLHCGPLRQTKLVELVCFVVLTSGPDEALMGRCACVMAGWSIDTNFVDKMVRTVEVGESLALLMRSVNVTTQVRKTKARAIVDSRNESTGVCYRLCLEQSNTIPRRPPFDNPPPQR